MADKTELKKILKDAIEKKNKINKGLDAEIRMQLMEIVGADLVSALTPLLTEMVGTRQELIDDFKRALKEINIKVPAPIVNIPKTVLPDIKLPQFPKIPTPVLHYNAPDIKIPEFPKEMSIEGWVKLQGYDIGLLQNPLPVQLRDARGNPLKLEELILAIANMKSGNSGGSGSGKTDFFTIKALNDGTGKPYDSTNPFPVTITGGATATSGSALVDSTGVQYSGSNPLPVTITSGGTATSASNIVDSSGVAYSGSNPIPVTQASQPSYTTAVAIVDSGGAEYSGSNPVPVVLAAGSNNTVGAALVDSNGVEYSGSNALPTYQANQPTFTTAVVLVDSAAVQYSTSNPIPVNLVSQSLASSASALVDSSGTQYSGSNPVPITGSINVLDSQASTITSHQDTTGDFRGLDVTIIRSLTVESALNSSVVALTGAAVFTGLPEDVKDFSTIQVVVFANQVSATDGLSIQQSIDGSNWDITDTFTIPASTGKTYSVQVAARYFRLVYTNGGSAQATFRLASYHHRESPKASSQRPQDGLSNENDFEQVSVFLQGLNSSGTWDRLHTNAGDSAGALRVVQATDSVSSVSVIGSISITGSITSTVATGPSTVGSTDDGTAPIQIAGIIRTTNPTKLSDNQVGKITLDAIGRQVMRPVQVRGLIQTAYVSISTGTETTLKTAPSATFLDLIYIMASNSSDAAVVVDVRAGTANGIVQTIAVPANGTAGVSLPVPIPQDTAAATWTVDMPDITGTTVYLSALFSQEV